jgi:hypothetical protein
LTLPILRQQLDWVSVGLRGTLCTDYDNSVVIGEKPVPGVLRAVQFLNGQVVGGKTIAEKVKCLAIGAMLCAPMFTETYKDWNQLFSFIVPAEARTQ